MKLKVFDKKLIWKISLIVLAIAVLISLRPMLYRNVSMVQMIAASDVILIDPGHGGMDGGASSATGVTEKEINLSIAFYLRELAEADGWTVVMTREEDKGLGDNTGTTIRSHKTADLNARIEMIRKVKPNLAVSIHLNSFKQDPSVRGAQTFYPAGPGDQAILDESKKLAEAIQAQLIEGLADGNDRDALGKRDARMLKNPAAPLVIIECGFLSNPEEARLLQQEDYQRKLAKCIYDGILLYTGKKPAKPIRTIDSRG